MNVTAFLCPLSHCAALQCSKVFIVDVRHDEQRYPSDASMHGRCLTKLLQELSIGLVGRVVNRACVCVCVSFCYREGAVLF
uniref:Putative secreted protein n=1 Tax=Anopheles darlingi TaxID=43151 RepID=A0A2M4DRF6_ANODA